MNKNIDTGNKTNKTFDKYKELIKTGKIHIINYEKENSFKNEKILYID